MSEIAMPRLSDTMEEGTVSRWLKQPGDPVHRGDVLAEIETDKATMDLEAYEEGILESLLVGEGETVPIGRPIAILGDGTSSVESPAPAPAPSAQPQAESPASAEPGPPASAEPDAPAPAPASAPADAEVPTGPEPEGAEEAEPAARDLPEAERRAGAVPRSPLARAVAERNGVDLSTVRGSGPGGRVVRADVEEAITRVTPDGGSVQGGRATAGREVVPAPLAAPGEEVEEIPLTTLRRVTARRLSEAAGTPSFSLTSVADAERLLSLRGELNGGQGPDEERVSVTDLLVKASASALRRHPEVNAEWAGDRILRHRRIHVGLAVAVPDGLVVPVVHDADWLGLGDIARAAHRLAARARDGQLSLEEVSGGTFTISNLGMLAVDHFNAVLNPPQAAVLAVGAGQQEAVVRDGEVVVRTTMKLTLSVDHRVLDGASAATFLAELVRLVEHPLQILA